MQTQKKQEPPYPIPLSLAQSLLSTYGSPLYIYSKQLLLQNIKSLVSSAPTYHISYAMKANSNPELLKIIKNNGIPYVDAVSPGEIYRALEAGYQGSDIMYTENFSTEEEIRWAIDKGVTINVGATETLERYGSIMAGKGIFVRVNPDKGAGENFHVITGGPQSKFGICSKELGRVRELANKYGITIVGLHQHIGSNLKKADKQIFLETTKFVFQKSLEFPTVKFINIGGGLGVKYKPSEQLFDNGELFSQICTLRDSYNPSLQLCIEPGRYLVANAGFLLCRITARKQTSQKVFYGTDTGFNHLIRPALYGSHHQIKNLNVQFGEERDRKMEKELASVCGNICECTDYLARDIMICGKIGDILCIENAGAYGFVMSSNFNQRPRPAEILIEDGVPRVIRRRQTFQDLKVKL